MQPTLLILLLLVSFSAEAKIRVITTTPELAHAARAIGGEHVDAASLLTGRENAHYVDAVPEFIRLVASADVLCQIGLGLEIGWLPKVLERSGNARVHPGHPGHCSTGQGVTVLEKPQGAVDRSMGDVHPEGNPHYWLSPSAYAEGSQVVLQALIAAEPKLEGVFRKNHADFVRGLADLQKRLATRFEALKTAGGLPAVIQYHTDFSYFLEAYGLPGAGSIEAKPGVAPSAGRLAEVALEVKKRGVRVALAMSYDPPATLARFAELSGSAVVRVPPMLVEGTAIDTYEKHQEHLVQSIIEALKDGDEPDAKGHGRG